MKFLNPFRKTYSDLANDEINATQQAVDRLQALADHHAQLSQTYQAGVDSIRGIKSEVETHTSIDGPVIPKQPEPDYRPTPLVRRTRSA